MSNRFPIRKDRNLTPLQKVARAAEILANVILRKAWARKQKPATMAPIPARGTKAYALALREAKAAWAQFRYDNGFAYGSPDITAGKKSNMKTSRSVGMIRTLSFAQARESGYNVCIRSTKGCRFACVAKNGNGHYPIVQYGRMVRVWFWLENPQAFYLIVHNELANAVAKYGAENVSFRMNTFSDINWQEFAPAWFGLGGSFYDYSKTDRVAIFDNYSITRSITENDSDTDIARIVESGQSVAVVLKVRGGYIPKTKTYRAIPTTYLGFPTVDGDKDDDRSKDPKGSMVILRAKGPVIMDLDFSRKLETV